ncbi:MAG: GDP-mannose 4,6-dehydratase [Planctomycetota bacterium]|nr:GDP-mannose 4,6-dehydratase [Planctomycetota bacterium]MDA1214718.1 GDP-mannose 4,6-dehydratase [Planctomycetota bacterium]
MSQIALITGASGQDGWYLTDWLIGQGYEVHGLIPCRAPGSGDARLRLHYGDLSDGSNLIQLLDEIQPDEVYNLAAQSYVGLSFELPVYTGDVTGLGALRLLEAVRLHMKRTGRFVKFYQASSSEMFGKVEESPQNERTPFHPRSPYACAKIYAHLQTMNYREAYGMFACSGILFNHESPRRGENFVTRKITRAAGRIKVGLQERLSLGNLDASRDWGFAGDYVRAMWLMLQHDKPDDYVIGTGETHSIREFLDEVFSYLELDWHDYVDVDPKYFRPAEVDIVCADASKAKRVLKWEPTISFRELARMMADHDLELAQRDLRLGK